MKHLIIMLVIIVSLVLSLNLSIISRPFKRSAPLTQARRLISATKVNRGVMMALRPPELQIPQLVQARVGQTTNIQIIARGRQGEPVQLTAGRVRNGTLNLGADGISRFTFTPDETQIGTTFIIFTVKNAHGLATSLATKIIVAPAVTARVLPVIKSPTITELPLTPAGMSVVSVPVAAVALPSAPPVPEPVKLAAPTNQEVTALDVVKAGPGGLVTLDLKPTQPDGSLTVVENLPLQPVKTAIVTEMPEAATPAAVNPAVAGMSLAQQVEVREAETAPLREMVLAPMAGETLTAGQEVMLAWFAPELDRAAEQEIRLSLDGGQTYDIPITPHVAAGQQSFNWVVPAGVTTQNARVRIVLRDAYGVETITDSAEFSIQSNHQEGAISLLNLNGHEKLVGGRPFTIRWKTNFGFQPLGYSLMVMLDGNRFIYLSNELPGNTQEFTWLVPADLNTAEARIQLTAYNIGGQPIPVLSSQDFRIVPEPAVGRVQFTEHERGDQLIIMGAGFVAKDALIEIDGVTFEPTNYSRANRQRLSNRLILQRSDLKKLLPADTIATITIRNRASGVRSIPYLFMRRRQ